MEKSLTKCQRKLDEIEKAINQMNKGKAKLDDMLSLGKLNCNLHGVGYMRDIWNQGE